MKQDVSFGFVADEDSEYTKTSIAIERHLKLLEESTASTVDAWLSKLDSTQQICSCHSCCQRYGAMLKKQRNELATKLLKDLMSGSLRHPFKDPPITGPLLPLPVYQPPMKYSRSKNLLSDPHGPIGWKSGATDRQGKHSIQLQDDICFPPAPDSGSGATVGVPGGKAGQGSASVAPPEVYERYHEFTERFTSDIGMGSSNTQTTEERLFPASSRARTDSRRSLHSRGRHRYTPSVLSQASSSASHRYRDEANAQAGWALDAIDRAGRKHHALAVATARPPLVP